MNIEDKLALSRRPGVISFIREGMFYRCYQQSLFFYLTQCDGKIKILGKARSGLPSYRCLDCKRTFQGRYIYLAYQKDGYARVAD